MSDALALIKAVNTVMTLATNMGISLQRLAQQQKQAEMEGREFGQRDLDILRQEAQKAVDDI